MKTITGIILSSLLLCVSAIGFTTDTPNKTLTTDGSSSDVQAAINAASDGWTVVIPAGSFTWTTGVVISGRGIKLRGAGSGRVIARSTSSVAIGTGTKTFATQSGLNITVGQLLRVERTGTEVSGGNATGIRGFMIGTVSSYSGTTLTMNITSIGGSGTHPLWIVSTTAATTIIHSVPGILFNLTESASAALEISGFKFAPGAGTDDFVQIKRSTNGKPVLVHDCFFESTSSSLDCIQSDSNQGVVWNCSFAAFPFSMAQLAIHHKNCQPNSWTTTSTMGANDTTGSSNLYIEDCDFHAWLNATDFDDNSRSVTRHCLFNNAGIGTHGADTSDYGVRHYEVYDCEFVFNGFNDGNTFNLNWWLYLRGGTGVITDNIMPNISSTDFGSKKAVNMTVMNLQRSAGPNPCWGAGQSGVQYPAPRQVGIGRVTGAAGNDSITYKGDSEPLYVWNNSGGYSVGTTDFGGTSCVSADSSADYIVQGRDYFNNGTSKPGYTKYVYPHPVRGPSGRPAAPTGLRVNSP